VNVENHRLGIVGAGRLGKVVARRLRDGHQVAVYDKDVRMAKQFTKQIGATFLYPDELVRRADVIALCLPGDQIKDWLASLDASTRAAPLYVNMATGLPTSALREDEDLRGLRFVGLKPLAQFVALDRGLPGLFVTSAADGITYLPLLARVFVGLGRVVAGDEEAVGEINGMATEAALRFCLDFTHRAGRFAGGAGWVEAALKNVVVGTILDYPPDPENAYTGRLLGRIGVGAPAEPGGTADDRTGGWSPGATR
jgi:hypothetical protein